MRFVKQNKRIAGFQAAFCVGLGSLKMLLIIEPLDNHLAELLHFIGRGGGEYGLPVALGKCGVIQPQSYATNNG